MNLFGSETKSPHGGGGLKGYAVVSYDFRRGRLGCLAK
jgi:hypothetical protein